MARKLFEDDTDPKASTASTAPKQNIQPPVTPPPPGKHSPLPQNRQNRRGGRWALWLLILFLLIVIGFLFALLNLRPDVVGLMRVADWRSTNASVLSTVGALETINAAQQQRDINLLNTQVSLDNFSALLAQTETQQAVNDFSTLTAVAVGNAQQATRAALDFAATQAALQQLSTQVQQEFLATQSALSGSLATIQANQPLQNILILNGDFVRGSETVNNASPSTVWAISDTGALIAQTPNATILTRRSSYPQNFTVNIGIIAANTTSYYDVLIGINESTSGSLLRIYHDSAQVTSAALYNIRFQDLGQADGVLVNEAQALASAPSLNLVGREIGVMVRVESRNLIVEINGTPAFETQTPTLPSEGAVGVQLRSGAQLQVLQVLPGNF